MMQGMSIHGGLLCSNEKGRAPAICPNVDQREGILLSEVSQMERETI